MIDDQLDVELAYLRKFLLILIESPHLLSFFAEVRKLLSYIVSTGRFLNQPGALPAVALAAGGDEIRQLAETAFNHGDDVIYLENHLGRTSTAIPTREGVTPEDFKTKLARNWLAFMFHVRSSSCRRSR